MEKNIEVELRALLPDIKEFEENLKKAGGKFIKSSYLCDVYFCKRSAVTTEEVEMHEVGSYSLRLRKSKNGENETCTLNTKTILSEGDHHAWEEHETSVSNFEEAAKILTLTEFKPFFKLEKNRDVYEYDGVEISIENIVDFGGAVEVEIMSYPGEEQASKEKIKTVLYSLGISEKDIVPKSITNIVMKERAFKQNISF
jgi:predicted adenylyl cyclase CyaB